MLLPLCDIALSQPLARLDELLDVDQLLAEHDGEADGREDPRNRAVELVGAGHLHCVGAPRGCPEDGGAGRGAGGAGIFTFALEEIGGEFRGGEGEEVERDEEEFVEGAEEEENFLVGELAVYIWV